MKALLFAVALLFYAPAFAAPFLKTDPVSAGVTHCGFYLDTAAVVVVPITGGICQLDVGTIAVGAHVSQVDARVTDPIWGNVTSPKSSALNFTRPGPPSAPTGQGLAP